MFEGDAYTPSPDWEAWVRETFIEDGGPLVNHEHEHLRFARIGILLSNETCRTKGKTVLGRAHVGEPAGSDPWQKGLKRDHLTRLFGEVPDFYLLLSATFIADRLEEGNTPAVCALIEHELYHCAQDMRDGMPLFVKATGKPKWRMRPHDVEEFVGVVRRYGAWSPELQALTDAAERGPTLARGKIEGVCGTCGSALAGSDPS